MDISPKQSTFLNFKPNNLLPFSLIIFGALFFNQIKAQTNPDPVSSYTTINPFKINKSIINRTDESILGEKEWLSLNPTFNHKILNEKIPKLEIVIPRKNTKALTLELEEFNIFSADFLITKASTTKGDLEFSLGKFYKGKVKGVDNSTVVLNIFEEEVSGTIDLVDESYSLVRIKNSPQYVLYQEKDLKEQQTLECFTDELKENIQKKVENTHSSRAENPDNCVRMYFEVDHDLFNQFGSVSATYNYLAGAFSQVVILYENENINITLNQVKVWDIEDPYTGPSTSNFYSQFRAAVGANFNGDLAHLVGTGGGGGIARVNALCNKSVAFAYSGINTSYQNVPQYSWTVNVLTHEIGHNLGSTHTHSCAWNGNSTQIDDCGNIYLASVGATPGACYDAANPIVPQDGGTIMSYCHLNAVGMNFNNGFGPQPGDLIRDRVYNATCLSECADCPEFGNVCDDGDPCTENDVYDSFCNCSGTVVPDNDGDGFCATEDPDDNDICVPNSCDNCTITTISITVDQYPAETTWEFVNSDGQIIASGAGYTSSPATQERQVCLDDGCYDFIIRDSFGDGICCGFGNGSYTVTDDSGNVIASGGEFASSETTNFCYDNFGECTEGSSCDDNDSCTENDVYDADCNCAGTFADDDGDGVCNAEDVCTGGDDNADSDGDGTPDFCDDCDNSLTGTSCDDNDSCTENDVYDADCNCAGTFADDDGDGVCNAEDVCPGGDDNVDSDGDGTPDFCEDCDVNLAGTSCDDNDSCTENDVYDADCNCAGTFADDDGDGVCNAEDVCPGGDDNVDSDGDGTPDFCDDCDANLAGSSCDDNDACTENDVYDADCNCAGTFADDDGDGVCNAEDVCPGGDDNVDSDGDGTADFCDDCDDSLVGTSCDDNDACTENDVYDADCNCAGTFADDDGDGVCNAEDVCPGGDDNVDSDGDGTPDFCDVDCAVANTSFPSQTLSQSGSAPESISATGINGFDVSFVVSNIDRKKNGKPTFRYTDLVTIEYVNALGNTVLYGEFSGENVTEVDVNIADFVQTVIVTLINSRGNGFEVNVSLSDISYCLGNSIAREGELLDNSNQSNAIKVFPNPFSQNLKIDLSEFSENINGSIQIIDQMGRRVMYIPTIENTMIEAETSNWTSGIYYIIYTTNDISHVKKAVHIE